MSTEILLYISLSSVFFLLLALFFLKIKEKELKAKVEALHEINANLQLQLSSRNEHKKNDRNPSKTSFVTDQIRKIESLEVELRRQKERVKDAKKVAQEATRLKHSFLSKVSDKLQLPLQSILSASASLDNHVEDKATLPHLQSIINSTRKLSVSIGEILALSKVESSSFTIQEKAVDARALFQNTMDKYKDTAHTRGLEFELFISENVPHSLMLDVEKVQEIVVHLIENAFEFTKDGFIHVKVDVIALHQAKNVVDLSIIVEDSGSGMDEKTKADIFTAFESRSPLEEDASESMGIGLSINKKVAQLMGGDLTVVSEPSKGSLFTLSLLNVEILLSGRDDKQDELNADFSLLDAKSSVVIIDEDENVQRFISESFASSSAEIFMYDNLRNAMETLKSKQIDLIFIDAEVYHVDEGAVAKVIANMSNASVVALASKRVKDIVLSDEGIKPFAYLKKPLSKVELFKVSLQVLNSK